MAKAGPLLELRTDLRADQLGSVDPEDVRAKRGGQLALHVRPDLVDARAFGQGDADDELVLLVEARDLGSLCSSERLAHLTRRRRLGEPDLDQ